MKDNFSQAIVENSTNIPTPTLTLGLTRGDWGGGIHSPLHPEVFWEFSKKRIFEKRIYSLILTRYVAVHLSLAEILTCQLFLHVSGGSKMADLMTSRAVIWRHDQRKICNLVEQVEGHPLNVKWFTYILLQRKPRRGVSSTPSLRWGCESGCTSES